VGLRGVSLCLTDEVWPESGSVSLILQTGGVMGDDVGIGCGVVCG
jgi:hypothetical protein